MSTKRGSLSVTKTFQRHRRPCFLSSAEIRMAAVKSQTINVDLEAPAASIRDFDAGISLDWDSFIATHQEATPFHSTAWMRALQATFHYENRSLYVQTGHKIT